MKMQQQYEALCILKSEIDEKLKCVDFTSIKNLILWLAKSENFNKLKKKDNQLKRLDFFCGIWMDEKKQPSSLGVEGDIFWDVHSLDEIENKYLTVKFGALRLETAMPEEFYRQAIDELIDRRISGIAIEKIISYETIQKEKNIVKIAQMLKERGQLITEVLLLEKASERYSGNKDVLLELADCWLTGQQKKKALECLKKIDRPDIYVQELIEELETSILNETL